MVAKILKAKDNRVFIDIVNLRFGKINEQLYDVIDDYTYFILIIPGKEILICPYFAEKTIRETSQTDSNKLNPTKFQALSLSSRNYKQHLKQINKHTPLLQGYHARSSNNCRGSYLD